MDVAVLLNTSALQLLVCLRTAYVIIACRQALTPTFSASKLKQMLGIVVQCTDHMVENLKEIAKENGGKFDSKG